MELVGPDIVIALGGPTANAVLGVTEPIMRARGTWRSLVIAGRESKREVAAMATLHPTYLLQTPAAKQLAWADLLKIKAKLREI